MLRSVKLQIPGMNIARQGATNTVGMANDHDVKLVVLIWYEKPNSGDK